MGLTLLPHSGVSLVFTGIAVSILNTPAPECAKIIQGTIAAAAVINEIIAVIMAKKGFERAGEFNKSNNDQKEIVNKPLVITISRQHGSGGREIGQLLSKALKIPFYDQKIIELSAKSSPIDKSFFENSETNGVGNLLHEFAKGAHNNMSINDKVFLQQSKIIREVAKKEDSIIVGRCADFILKDKVDLLRVFIYANREDRKNRIVNVYKETNNINDKEINNVDKKRTLYYNYYTNQKFGAAENYDLCLNSSEIDIDECVKIIKKVYINKKKNK